MWFRVERFWGFMWFSVERFWGLCGLGLRGFGVYVVYC